MNIVILGPQGSGKGTQAKLLVEKYGFAHIETGEILRKIAQSDHKWGKRIKDMMNRGVLVSDDILNAILRESLSTAHPNGYLFDGTPRNYPQYELIKKILASYNEKIDKVAFINIPENETVRRLSSRRTCKDCGLVYNLVTNPPPANGKCQCGGDLVQREDDFPEAIKKRLEAFNSSTKKVIESAEKDGVLIKIDGEQLIEDIHNEIVEKLGL